MPQFATFTDGSSNFTAESGSSTTISAYSANAAAVNLTKVSDDACPNPIKPAIFNSGDKGCNPHSDRGDKVDPQARQRPQTQSSSTTLLRRFQSRGNRQVKRQDDKPDTGSTNSDLIVYACAPQTPFSQAVSQPNAIAAANSTCDSNSLDLGTVMKVLGGAFGVLLLVTSCCCFFKRHPRRNTTSRPPEPPTETNTAQMTTYGAINQP